MRYRNRRDPVYVRQKLQRAAHRPGHRAVMGEPPGGRGGEMVPRTPDPACRRDDEWGQAGRWVREVVMDDGGARPTGWSATTSSGIDQRSHGQCCAARTSSTGAAARRQGLGPAGRAGRRAGKPDLRIALARGPGGQTGRQARSRMSKAETPRAGERSLRLTWSDWAVF